MWVIDVNCVPTVLDKVPSTLELAGFQIRETKKEVDHEYPYTELEVSSGTMRMQFVFGLTPSGRGQIAYLYRFSMRKLFNDLTCMFFDREYPYKPAKELLSSSVLFNNELEIIKELRSMDTTHKRTSGIQEFDMGFGMFVKVGPALDPRTGDDRTFLSIDYKWYTLIIPRMDKKVKNIVEMARRLGFA